MDDYLLDHSNTRIDLAAFLRWAAGAHHSPRSRVTISAPPDPTVTITVREFWAKIDRFDTDDTLPTRVRVAALLVALFGQPLTHLVQLTKEHITTRHETVTMRLGTEPVVLPPNLGRLVLKLSQQQPKWATSGSPDWLFPSIHAGRSLSPSSLGEALRKHGFTTSRMRPAAMNHLAAHIPVGPFVELTGASPQAAQRWSQLAGRPWGAYVPLRSEHPTNSAQAE